MAGITAALQDPVVEEGCFTIREKVSERAAAMQ
jgi:hypothetical protein